LRVLKEELEIRYEKVSDEKMGLLEVIRDKENEIRIMQEDMKGMTEKISAMIL
jgi:hypothetical protein